MSGGGLYPTARKRSFGARLRAGFHATRWSFARLLIRVAFALGKGPRKPYQPVRIGRGALACQRDAETRWQATAQLLRDHKVRSVLDIGSAEGFFVARAARDLGCFAIGVEASDRAALGTLALTYNRAERAAIARAFVSAEDLRAWPKFDAVICMSVAHHILRAHGLEPAEDFVAACASCAARVLIFEMGTGEEKAFEHALPSEARDQERFVRALLERAGLENVRIIAETGAYHQGATRLLFAAEPQASKPDAASHIATLR